MLPGMLCIMYSQVRATGEREQSITGNSNLSSHNSLSSNNIYPFLLRLSYHYIIARDFTTHLKRFIDDEQVSHQEWIELWAN